MNPYTGPLPSTSTFKAFSLGEMAPDATNPDNRSAMWPLPHDAKVDIATILVEMFKQLGLEGDLAIPVKTNGGFHSSLLTVRKQDSDGAFLPGPARPVVVVLRSEDVGLNIGIGDRLGATIKGGAGGFSSFDDPQNVIPFGAAIDVQGQLSAETIDVYVFDTNDKRADQVYTTIKLLMVSMRKVMIESLGYTNVSRVGGGDSQDISVAQDGGNPLQVHVRTLTFRCEHPDIVERITPLVDVVKQSLTLDPSVEPDADVTITTAL